MKLYTPGEILKEGLVKNADGSSAKNKVTIRKAMAKMKPSKVATMWGMANGVSLEQIQKYNKSRML